MAARLRLARRACMRRQPTGIQVATATQAQFEKMCDVLGRGDIKVDPAIPDA